MKKSNWKNHPGNRHGIPTWALNVSGVFSLGAIAPKLLWEKEFLSDCRKKIIRDMEKYHENSAPTLCILECFSPF